MRTAIGACGALAVVASAPAMAAPARENARPKVVSATAQPGAERAVTVTVVGRDHDDVVRGIEIAWGDGAEQGLSSCGAKPRRRTGRKARFELSYAYPAAGSYNVTVRVLSGGCGKRAQQRSSVRTLAVQVD